MTKLEALNKIITEKLDGTKEGKTILEAVNLATKAYGGTGKASNLGDAIEQLYSVFTKGGGEGGDEHITFDFSQAIDMEKSYIGALTLLSYAKGKVSYKGVNIEGLQCFPGLAGAAKVTSVDYTGIGSTKNITDWSGFLMGVQCEEVDLSPLDFSGLVNCSGAFQNCSKLKTLDLSMLAPTTQDASYDSSVFANCESLQTLDISKWNIGNTRSISTWFTGCTSLTHIEFMPSENWFTEGKDTIDFSYSPLDRETVIQLFNNLGTVTSGAIVLNPTTLALLSDTDKAIATDKGWSLT